VNDIFNILRNREVVGEIFGDMTNGPHLSGSTSVVVVTMNTGDAGNGNGHHTTECKVT
jgi:hypothetical protein